ncbi:MAG: hypothetical protein WD076_10180 [Parvularculaceae bacterium]
MKLFLIALSATIAVSTGAHAQKRLTLAEGAMCAGYKDYLDRVDNQNKAEARRLDSMSVNRRNASSVDRYNDQVSRVNALADLGTAIQAHYTTRCGNFVMSSGDVNELCYTPKFGASIASGGFCSGFKRVSSLNEDGPQQDAAEEGAPFKLVAAEIDLVRVESEHVQPGSAEQPEE